MTIPFLSHQHETKEKLIYCLILKDLSKNFEEGDCSLVILLS